MKLDVTKKNVLITGASGKIGAVLCEQLLSNYNLIAITSRSESYKALLNLYSEQIEDNRVAILQHDLCSEKSREDLLRFLEKNEITIYGLINNARNLENLVQDKQGYVKEKYFLDEFNLGVYAPYYLSWQLAKLTGCNLKRVINISSIYGVVATNRNLYDSENKHIPPHYGVSKAALIHLTKELAARLSNNKITVNAISYGGVEGRADEQFKIKYAQLCPQSSMLNHEDLSGAVAFLLSEEARSITGHNLLVDGGWTIW